MIEIVAAPPYLAVQDLGFTSGRIWGMPPGGAMDAFLLMLANRMVGNAPGAAGLEWALGSGVIRFTRKTRVAVLLGDVFVGEDLVGAAELPFTAPARAPLTIVPGAAHCFCYLAVGGGLAVPQVLGSRSTYLQGGFGGHQGRRLAAGDRIPLLRRPGKPAPWGAGPRVLAISPAGNNPRALPDLTIRVTRGPQWDRFAEPARAAFFAARYRISADSDRMGYRLSGPPIRPRDTATLPSEAACPGAIQIPDGGEPIVLMPDGPTVGGYPKLAVVIQADLRLLAQGQPERGVRFREVSLETARAAALEDPLGLRALERAGS